MTFRVCERVCARASCFLFCFAFCGKLRANKWAARSCYFDAILESQFPCKHTQQRAASFEAAMMAMVKNWSVSTANALQMRGKNTIEKQICTLPIWKWLPSNNYCLQHVTRQTMIIIYSLTHSLTRRVALWHERYISGIYSLCHNVPSLFVYSYIDQSLITAFWSITFFFQQPCWNSCMYIVHVRFTCCCFTIKFIWWVVHISHSIHRKFLSYDVVYFVI